MTEREYLEMLAFRRKMTFTQAEMAKRLGLAQPTLSALERGAYLWRPEWYEAYCSLTGLVPLPEGKNPLRFKKRSEPRRAYPFSVPLTAEEETALTRMAAMVGVSKAECVRQALAIVQAQLFDE